jgi:hypothetical protein
MDKNAWRLSESLGDVLFEGDEDVLKDQVLFDGNSVISTAEFNLQANVSAKIKGRFYPPVGVGVLCRSENPRPRDFDFIDENKRDLLEFLIKKPLVVVNRQNADFPSGSVIVV